MKTLTYYGVMLFLFFSVTYKASAQATFTQGSTPAQLATELSANGGFTITTPVITNGATDQRGVYSNGAGAGLTLNRGILLSTGKVNTALANQSSTLSQDFEQGATYNDGDLTAINAQSINDVVVYEFDFTIAGTDPKIFALDYQFASEEYPEYVCSDKNDIFGFFVSGGDLVGTSNLAKIGGTNMAVNYVNGGAVGTLGNAALNPCTLTNSSSFVQNYVLDDNGTPADLTDDFPSTTVNGPHHMSYNGFTTRQRAYTVLRPGITYHMKMTIADTADSDYDSGVFVSPIQIFDLPAQANIDFDGVDDYVNTNPFLGGLAGATMSTWFKLDSGFAGIGELCGQENFRLLVDAAGRLKTAASTGSNTITYTLKVQDNSPVDSWMGYAQVRVNAGPWLQFNVGGALNDQVRPAVGLSEESFSFEVNAGDNIEVRYVRDGTTPADMNDSGYQLINEEGTVVHTTAYNTITGDQTNSYTAACASCTAPVTIITPDASAPTLNTDLWYHATTVFDGAAGTLTLYLNGDQVWKGSGLGGYFNKKDDVNSFEVGRRSTGATNYFTGAIDEVKVFNKVLNANQIREQIYQEVMNIGGKVTGTELLLPIDGGSLNWSDLILYYDMNLIYDITIIDNSAVVRNGFLNNITSVMAQTAPLPFIANASGAWTTQGTWQYGNVWDAHNLPHKDWVIVRLTNNSKVTTVDSHTTLGLLVDGGSELEIQNDQQLRNTKYILLDGQIDLVGESQLVQTASSSLDVASSGYLERDQSGKSSVYHYNHWSSPVGAINTTTNNADFTLATIVRDGTDPNNPQPVNFTGAWDGAPTTPISISEGWIFKFANHPDNYDNWILGHVKSTGAISPGEGYSQKGSGTASGSQNYVFVGKPNNGVISRPVGGGNLYLMGNPYPSALDANQFILDNVASVESSGDVIGSGTTTGALYFWEHWGGNSHFLAQYEGGYATYNLTGATLAVPDPDVSSNGAGSVLPKRYVPVGQGFFVQGSLAGGTIEFNNGQRAFQRESDGNSVFVSRSAGTPPMGNEIDKVYFRFTTPEGPKRQLLLGVKEGLPKGVNYGYDAPMIYKQHTDCSWTINDAPYVIQTIGELNSKTVLPLEIKVGTAGVCKFETEGLNDLEDNINVYFRDKKTGERTQLEEGVQVQFELEAGDHKDRFSVVFDVKEIALDNVSNHEDNLTVGYNAANNTVFVAGNDKFSMSAIRLYNILGQEVMSHGRQYDGVQTVYLPVNVSTGTYILNFMYNNETRVSKKIMIKK